MIKVIINNDFRPIHLVLLLLIPEIFILILVNNSCIRHGCFLIFAVSGMFRPQPAAQRITGRKHTGSQNAVANISLDALFIAGFMRFINFDGALGDNVGSGNRSFGMSGITVQQGSFGCNVHTLPRGRGIGCRRTDRRNSLKRRHADAQTGRSRVQPGK